MARDTAALPPLLLPKALYDALEAERAVMQMMFGAIAVSRTAAFTELVRIGLRDLAAEIREQTGTLDTGSDDCVQERTGVVFITLSPSRGSRWAPQTNTRGVAKRRGKAMRGAPAGFVRLTTMVVSQEFFDVIDATHVAFDTLAPGLVASRSALLREALARGLATFKRQRESHREMSEQLAGLPSFGEPTVAKIPLSVLFPELGRAKKSSKKAPRAPTRRRRARRRPRAHRAKRLRTRSRDPDDGEPARSQNLRRAPSLAWGLS